MQFVSNGETFHMAQGSVGCRQCPLSSDGRTPDAHHLAACNGTVGNLCTKSVGFRVVRGPVPHAPGTKLSNPKQAMGDAKVPLHLVPTAAVMHESLAYAEGAMKYGTANWRVAGVRTSTYIAACLRHVTKYWNGENHDPVSRVHHLGNARACLGIVLDAEQQGKLTDDRPPAQDLTELVAELEGVLAHLKELHKDCNPKHYTEQNKDTE